MSKSFSTADVASHKTPEEGMYIIIDEGVYDVTSMPAFPPFHSPPFSRPSALYIPAPLPSANFHSCP